MGHIRIPLTRCANHDCVPVPVQRVRFFLTPPPLSGTSLVYRRLKSMSEAVRTRESVTVPHDDSRSQRRCRHRKIPARNSPGPTPVTKEDCPCHASHSR